MPVEVLHLLGTAEVEGSGIARIVMGLAAGLDPLKYRVHAWFLGPSGPLMDDLQSAGAIVRQIDWSRGAKDPMGAWRFWCGLRGNEFAIVHQHVGARSIRYVIRRSSDAGLVVHLHGGSFGAQPTSDVPLAVRGSDAVIAVSYAVARQLPSVNSVVVHAGVSPSTRRDAKIDAPSPTTIIGTACRLVQLKGVLHLIRAVALLQPELPAIRLEIAGAGPERNRLETEVDRLGLWDTVRFLGWRIDLDAVLSSWDIFALASLEEGFGMAALDAMSAGLPVIGTEVGGLPELVEHGRTGYVVPRSDVAALAGALRHLILHPEHSRAMGAAGRIRARDHFSVNRMVAEIEAVYDSLLLARSARPMG